MSKYSPEERKVSELFLSKIQKIIDYQSSTLVNFVCLFNHHQCVVFPENYPKKITVGGAVVPNLAESEAELHRWKKFYKIFFGSNWVSKLAPSCSLQNFDHNGEIRYEKGQKFDPQNSNFSVWSPIPVTGEDNLCINTVKDSILEIQNFGPQTKPTKRGPKIRITVRKSIPLDCKIKKNFIGPNQVQPKANQAQPSLALQPKPATQPAQCVDQPSSPTLQPSAPRSARRPSAPRPDPRSSVLPDPRAYLRLDLRVDPCVDQLFKPVQLQH